MVSREPRGRGRGARRRTARLVGPVAAIVLVLSMAAAGGPPAGTAPGDPAAARMMRLANRLKAGTPAIRSISQRATIETLMDEGSLTFAQRLDLVLPDKVRRTMVVDGQEQAIVISGGHGCIMAGGRTLPLPADRLRPAVEALGRELLVLADAVGGRELEIGGAHAVELDGASCQEIEVSLRGVESRLCVDAQGDVLRQTFPGAHPLTGTVGRIEVLFSDYRDAGGVRYPYHQQISFDGRSIVVVDVEDLRVNLELDPALFLVPQEP